MKRKVPNLDAPYPKHRVVSDEERRQWKDAFEDKPAAKGKARAVKMVKMQEQPAVKPPAPPRAPSPVIEKNMYARIRRGAIRIDGTLDLHGMSRDGAQLALVAAVTMASMADKRTLLVITGKGKDGKGALREQLPLWLRESPLREYVIAYDCAGPRHGGSGAWYVRIRKS